MLFAGLELKPGVTWDSNQRTPIWSFEKETLEKQSNISNEQKTMKIIAEVTSDILGCLKFTLFSPKSNSNAKMPMLDTQMLVGHDRGEKTLSKGMGHSETLTEVGNPLIL